MVDAVGCSVWCATRQGREYESLGGTSMTRVVAVLAHPDDAEILLVVPLAPWGVAGLLTPSGTLILARSGSRKSMRSQLIRARPRRTGRSSSGAITRSMELGVTGGMPKLFATCPWPL